MGLKIGQEAPPSELRYQVGKVVGKETQVAGQDLIAALAIQSDGHAGLPGQSENLPLGVNTGRPKRLLEVVEQLRPILLQARSGWIDRAGVHRARGGHCRDVAALVVARIRIARRESHLVRFHAHHAQAALAGQPVNHTHDRRGVNPTAQTGTDRHIADQVRPHGTFE
jgi:hypothetical protein